ncbi:hypothetical protein D9M68_727150 [compost metagenome]
MLAQRRETIRMAVARQLRRRHPGRGAHGLVQAFLVEPVPREPAGAGLDRHGMVGEHVRQQPGRVQSRRFPLRRTGAAGGRVTVRHGVAGARPRGQVAQRGQPPVGLGHGEGADLVVLGKAAYRRQRGAGAQRTLLHQRGDAGDDLLGQGFAAAAAAGQVQGQHRKRCTMHLGRREPVQFSGPRRAPRAVPFRVAKIAAVQREMPHDAGKRDVARWRSRLAPRLLACTVWHDQTVR